ncbi:MAG: hypothetical protein BWY87_01473 [Deltaproteobacteria bacterium ADurb.Bin510]|nr:MAG: hypothetical protein BWY87_01473 [Deltaproteobacteria bacterium ADurb.Bin510]
MPAARDQGRDEHKRPGQEFAWEACQIKERALLVAQGRALGRTQEAPEVVDHDDLAHEAVAAALIERHNPGKHRNLQADQGQRHLPSGQRFEAALADQVSQNGGRHAGRPDQALEHEGEPQAQAQDSGVTRLEAAQIFEIGPHAERHGAGQADVDLNPARAPEEEPGRCQNAGGQQTLTPATQPGGHVKGQQQGQERQEQRNRTVG